MGTSVQADLLVTSQGESLSGELSRVLNGILVFRTSMQGQMMVPMSEVKALTTDTAWAVSDSDGAIYIGRFVQGGIETSAGGDTTKLEPILPAAIVSAKPIPSGFGNGASGQEPSQTWSAEGGAGVRAFEGAEDGMAPHVSLGVRGADARGEVNLDVGFDVEGDEGFPNYFRGRFEAAGVPDQPWGPFVQAIAERDRYNALDLRTGLTVGVRYAFDAPHQRGLYGIVGLAGTLDRWDSNEAPEGWENAEGETSRSDLSMHLELRYSRALLGRGSWDSRLYALPSLTDADHFRAGAESSLVYPVTSRLQLRLDMLMKYEQDPVFESIDRIDTSLGASIQLNF